MVKWLEGLFPNLHGTDYHLTSPATDAYNCIAWAVAVANDWWWPVSTGRAAFWPANVPREETVAAFREMFIAHGYVVCAGEELEPAFLKVAVFATPQQLPTHAARQLPTGRWTSKLGQGEDIEHDLRALEGDLYGAVVLLMKRPM